MIEFESADKAKQRVGSRLRARTEMNEIVHAAANRHRNSHSNIIYQGGFGGGKASHCRTVSHT